MFESDVGKEGEECRCRRGERGVQTYGGRGVQTYGRRDSGTDIGEEREG